MDNEWQERKLEKNSEAQFYFIVHPKTRSEPRGLRLPWQQEQDVLAAH